MTFTKSLLAASFVVLSTFSVPAIADEGAQAFVEREHVRVTELLKQPASPARDTQVVKALETMVDYDEVARRAFGDPCPSSASQCANHWSELTEAQRTEVRGLLKNLVERNYRKNLVKTLDYEVIFKGQKEISGNAKVRTEARSRLKPRDPAVQVDYIVRAADGKYRVVDVITEGSSLTKNYYDQFHRMMTNPSQGFAHITKKLREKLEKKD